MVSPFGCSFRTGVCILLGAVCASLQPTRGWGQPPGWPGGVSTPPRRTWVDAADTAALYQRLARAGYLSAQFRMAADTPGVHQIFPGPWFGLEDVHLEGLPAAFELAAPRNRPPSGTVWDLLSVQRYAESRYREVARSGYPFAQLSSPELSYRAVGHPLDTFWVSVSYQIVPGPFQVWGLPVPNDRVRESPRWLAAHLGLWPGTPVSAQVLGEMTTRVERGGRYVLDSLTGYQLNRDSLRLTMHLTPRRTNRFDALLGLLPPRGADQDWRLTALVDLQLVSALRLGERLSLKYEQFPGTSRRVDLGFELPYLAGSTFSGGLQFNLFKQDSTFQTLRFEPTLRYSVSALWAAELFLQLTQSGLLDVEPYRDRVWPPPPVLDSRANYTGVALRYDSRDRSLNPTRGVQAYLSYGLGRKRIRRTVGLDSLDFSRLAQDQPKQEIRFQAEGFQPLAAQQVLRLGLNGYWVGLREYFDSDLQQLGGARSLRGFNENQFLSSAYAYASAEYRLLVGELSFVGLFSEYGWVERRDLFSRSVQWPFSVGLSLALETKAGLLTVQYAVGQTSGQPFQVARGRVHIGLLAIF